MVVVNIQNIGIGIGMHIYSFGLSVFSDFSYKYIDLYGDKQLFSYWRTIHSFYLLIALFSFDIQQMLMVIKLSRPIVKTTIITTIKMTILYLN